MTEATKQSKTQVQRKEEAVRKILEAAIELIALKGVQDLTMAEIGVHAGYSRGLPHQHFGTKEQLIQAVLQAIVKKFNHRRRNQSPAADGLDSIKALIATYLERDPAAWQASKAFIMLISDASLAESPHQEFINNLHQKNIAFISKHLEVARKTRPPAIEVSDHALAVVLMSTMRGLALQALTDASMDLKAVHLAINQILDKLLPNVAAAN